ncbi:MAG: hypothetical protein GQ548_04615 [Methylophaga sp.]|nr:hypothetical protein [Methylophaga sp.]
MNKHEDEFEKNIKQQLNASLESIDESTRSKLTKVRYKALNASNTTSSPFTNWLTPLLSTAVVALLLITLLPSTYQRDEEIILTTEFIMISEMEDIELYDDIEFYQWLETVDNNS